MGHAKIKITLSALLAEKKKKKKKKKKGIVWELIFKVGYLEN